MSSANEAVSTRKHFGWAALFLLGAAVALSIGTPSCTRPKNSPDLPHSAPSATDRTDTRIVRWTFLSYKVSEIGG